ncbi:hypothetical protein PybrP1_004551 [[Pythium] brassicae (nom. inval.)]|nr:hypothetical protein PybrP1_004551 [[Pythium] brassicae (nom. inval.)]
MLPAVSACLRQRISPRRASISAVPLRSGSALRARGAPFDGFELLFLGTSAGSPSVRRNPTALCLRLPQHVWLFDCAEGSLRQLMKSAVRVPLTSKFFITHMHGDHLYGLPGILCTLDNHNAGFLDARTRQQARRPIEVYGPLGLFAYLNTALTTSTTRMANLCITVHELVSPEMLANASAHERYMRKAPKHPCLKRETIHAKWDGQGYVWDVLDDGKVKVQAAELKHTVTCFGYVVEEHPLPGRLNAAALRARGLAPGPLYKELKSGASVTLPSGETIHASEVTGPPARGRKVVILGDTADTSRMFDIGQNCDVLVHEATLSHEMAPEAVHRGHSTARMAGFAARKMNATLLALTHFSHRFRHWGHERDSRTTLHLALEAQTSFGRRAVVPATDFLRIPASDAGSAANEAALHLIRDARW